MKLEFKQMDIHCLDRRYINELGTDELNTFEIETK